MLPTTDGRVNSLWNLLQRLTVESSQLSLLNRICSYLVNFSQSNACTVSRFGECSSTLLEKLWYLYSYIYNQATIIVPILLFVIVILMPTTDQPTISSSTVSPSPHLSQTRSFTMTNYTLITDWSL